MSVRNNHSYLKSLEWFRGLAIVFVVFTHVDASSLSNISGGDYLRRFFSNGTFYFVFISGYLFWHLINKFEYKKFISNKIRNVLVPYFFILTPILILFSAFKAIDDSPASLLNQYLVGGGVVGPLWFIPMILIVFLISPAIVGLARSRFFWLVLVVTLFISLTSFRPPKHVYPICMFMHFIGVFLFGIFLKIKEEYLRRNAGRLIFYLAPAALVSLVLDVIQYREGLPYFWPLVHGEFVLNYAQIQKLISTVIFLAVFFKLEEVMPQNRSVSPLKVLSKYSFGIFFFHWYFIFMKGQLVKNGIISAQYAGIGTYFIDAFVFTFMSIALCRLAIFILGPRARYVTGVS